MRSDMDSKSLIASLSEDLAPVKRPAAAVPTALAWLALTWAVATGLVLFFGPMRPGWTEPFLTSPRYLVEAVLGFATAVAAAVAALRLSTPSTLQPRRAMAPAFTLFAAWIGLLAYGFVDPAVEPSMVGKRPHCFVETWAYASVPVLLGAYLAARRAVLAPVPVAALFGLAAASVPALLMQWACMYEPYHALTHHILPVGLVGVVSAVAASRLIPKL